MASVAGLSVELPKSLISVTLLAPMAGIGLIKNAVTNAVHKAALTNFVRFLKFIKLLLCSAFSRNS